MSKFKSQNEIEVGTNSTFEIPTNIIAKGEEAVFEFAAPKIEAAWSKSKDAIFEVGAWLVAAKNATEHGDWDAFCERLPFSSSTAKKLREIAECSVFQNLDVYKVLPVSWGTLHELSLRAKEDEALFLEKVEGGSITPDMTKEHAKHLFGATSSSSGPILSVPKIKTLKKKDGEWLLRYRDELANELNRVSNVIDEKRAEFEEAA